MLAMIENMSFGLDIVLDIRYIGTGSTCLINNNFFVLFFQSLYPYIAVIS